MMCASNIVGYIKSSLGENRKQPWGAGIPQPTNRLSSLHFGLIIRFVECNFLAWILPLAYDTFYFSPKPLKVLCMLWFGDVHVFVAYWQWSNLQHPVLWNLFHGCTLPWVCYKQCGDNCNHRCRIVAKVTLYVGVLGTKNIRQVCCCCYLNECKRNWLQTLNGEGFQVPTSGCGFVCHCTPYPKEVWQEARPNAITCHVSKVKCLLAVI